MPIDTLCPGCQAKLRMGEEFAGKEARCPRCDAIYVVPEAAPVEAAVASEPPSVEPTAPPVVADAAPQPIVGILPPADGTRWFLRTPEGPIYGPANKPTFERWVTEGRVTPDCLVCPGDNVWRPAAQLFPELTIPREKPVLRPATLEKFQKQPHRGALILILGIMGIVTTCPIPSIMAWVMGSHDLGEMQNGRMDERGHGVTNVGRLLGLIFSMVYIVSAVIAMFVLVLIAAKG